MRYFLAFIWALLLTASGAQALTQNQRLVLTTAYTQDPDAAAYIARVNAAGCPVPWLSLKRATSIYIVGLKSIGSWGHDDLLYFSMNDPCTGSVNLARPPLYQVTWNGTYTVTGPTGWSGDSATGYGDTNVAQSALVRATQNNARVEECAVASNGNILGGVGAAGIFSIIPTTNTATRISSAVPLVDVAAPKNGCHAAWRTSSTVATTVFNGAVLQSGAASASAAPGTTHTGIGVLNGAFCNATCQIYVIRVGNPIANEAADYSFTINYIHARGGAGI